MTGISRTSVDIAVIGGGPAGLAAAIAASTCGADTLLLDEQAAPGGQVHRAIESRSASGQLSGADDADGAALVRAFRTCSSAYWPGAAVWQIEPAEAQSGFRIFLSRSGRSEMVMARRLILATGAMERPVPIPGWTLPGVMTVGGAQILLKTGGNLPPARTVIAGQGPLVLLYATQMLKAGARPLAVLDTTPAGGVRRALPHLAGAVRDWRQVWRGFDLMRLLHKAGIPIIRAVSDVEATGTDRLDGVRYRVRGQWHALEADMLLLHEGVVPHTHMALSLGAEHSWDEAQQCWRPVYGSEGQSSIPGLGIAGDGGGIGGWRVAVHDGRIAGLEAARALGYATPGMHREKIERQRARATRPLLDAFYRPRSSLLVPADTVIVCRCEEKTAGDVRAAVALGCLGPNQVKAFTRCGMGPCQGRSCVLTLTTLVAAARGVSPQQVGPLRIRPPLKPISLGELASLADDPANPS